MESVSSASTGGGTGKSKRSHLLTKFGKSKAVDPFEEEERRVMLNMQAGMTTVLDMHNPAELASLCGVLCLPTDGNNAEKKASILEYITQDIMKTHNPEKTYAEVLHLIWEGILYEYLRASGMPLRTADNDPRIFTLQLWRKQAQQMREKAFKPHYIPRNVVTRLIKKNNDVSLDSDLMAVLEGIEVKEIASKRSEAKMRSERDYRNVVTYLSCVTDMHDYERDARNYLIGEVQQLRSRMSHQQVSLDITMMQLEELEERHMKMGEGWCRTLASQEAAVDMVNGLVSDQLSDRNAMGSLIRDYLEVHGGKKANHLTGAEDIEELLAKLLARCEIDDRVSKTRVQTTEELLAKTMAEMKNQGEVLAHESQRADIAERELKELRAKYAALQEGTARALAQKETEARMLYNMASAEIFENATTHRRFEMVRPHLEAMLDSGTPTDERLGAGLLEGLGIMDRDGVMEHLERTAMRREELQMRTAIAMGVAIDPPPAAAPPPGSAGGGKEGKGGKKGGSPGPKKAAKGKKK